MTTRTKTRVAILAALVVGLLSAEAVAWGPRAQRSITVMAMQVIRNDYNPNAFKPGGSARANFEKDVMRGCQDGYDVLKGTTPLGTEAEVIQAVRAEIQLLRDVSRFGPSSYFAYRMGVLSALVADIMVPYGFARSDTERQIQAKMFNDIDAHLDSYGFAPRRKHRTYIRDAQEYYRKFCAFYEEDKKIIAEDYLRGAGYNSFLAEGARAYFAYAIEAVADAWHTVFRPQPDPTQVPASRRILTWYFVNEISYQLRQKRNLHQADVAYERFEAVNPDIAAAYEQIGDLYYERGDVDAELRGVREWRIAHNLGGPDRDRLVDKLAGHYLKNGEELLARAESPQVTDTDLDDALRAFEVALEFKRADSEIAGFIQDTHIAINERRQRYEMTLNIISTGERVQEEADKTRLDKDYDKAIKTYNQSITFFEAVDDEFKDQEKIAKESIRRLKKNINDVINQILDEASDAIDDGNQKREQHKYDEAIVAYRKVESIVSVIPAHENPDFKTDKEEMLALAQQRIQDAKEEKVRYQQAKAEQERLARERGAQGGAPAPAPAPQPPQ